MGSKIKGVVHKENLTAEERAGFNQEADLQYIIEMLKNGTSGKTVLISKRDNPDENVEIEYKKIAK